MKHSKTTNLLFALLLLITGTVLLLNNLGIINLGIKNVFHFVYPFVLLIIGLYWFLQALDRKKNSQLLWGLFIIVFSGLLVSNRFGLISFGFWDFLKLWPLIFLYYAYQLLFNSKRPRITFTLDSAERKGNDNQSSYFKNEISETNLEKYEYGEIDLDEIMDIIEVQLDNDEVWDLIQDQVRFQLSQHLNSKKINEIIKEIQGAQTGTEINQETNHDSVKFKTKKKSARHDENSTAQILGLSVGDIQYNSKDWLLEPLHLNYTIANYFIDFSKAFIPEGETPVFIHGKIGDVEILIPEEIPVKVTVRNSIGNVSIFDQEYARVGGGTHYYFESENYQEASRKINLDIKISVGSVEIEKV